MAFKMHEIRELIRLIDESQIEEFEIQNEETTIKMKKNNGVTVPTTSLPVITQPVVQHVEQSTPVVSPVTPVATEVTSTAPVVEANPAAVAPGVEDATLHKIVSPMVGTFYRAPSPDSQPYVKEGDQVQNETIVCIVEAMKLMNEIDADVNGTIVKVLVENGQLVEYGQPLFLVKTS
ncbi:acetyl-CoA carboxylase biotin carboxyl carrier protein [Thermoactinomyces sp. DSM 45892]|uniref:acetyl-CoA carboxylase biotin carboxyl carrier protein n=1 Tax=Thermoactinomyces sp. DSM 45892 TaxID=1882753 RepID=UPI000897356F|nr:acetyl-CoA carboxylase biotin carboxyl carrier protein [Thermoactinomyces sp. DSM 45892]SDZ03279.1 acetyl-CoA carboxylase biotin carboxyl carrier protein [Thermoactinomyces sp. DSM 45892]